jgi:DNA-binding response OmpR family regulator
MRILLAEDDPLLGEGLRAGLRQLDFQVDWVRDGEAAERELRAQPYAAAVLDLGLPLKDGLPVLASVRKAGISIPILVLTARDGVPDRIRGLDVGADDYVVKPVDLNELAARLRALIRRAHGEVQERLCAQDVVLDPSAHTVHLLQVAQALQRQGLCTLLFDLLTLEEAEDLGVDADDRAASVEKRAARTTRIHGRVAPDEGHGDIAGQRPAFGTDDALRGRLLEAEGRADRQHRIADLQLLHVTQAHDQQASRIDAQHGNVGDGVAAQHLGLEFAPIAEFDPELRGVAHQVRVAQNQPFAPDDEAGALVLKGDVALRCAVPQAEKIAKELENRIVLQTGRQLSRG